MNFERRELRTPPSDYSEAVRGNHPDLHVSREKLDGMPRNALAIHMLQREAFTSACLNLATSIVQSPRREILKTMSEFETSPSVQKFLPNSKSYNLIAYGLLRYKYREQKPEELLERHSELDNKQKEGELTEPQSRELYQLNLYFQFNTPGRIFKKYEELINSSKRRPLRLGETARLQTFKQQIINDSNLGKEIGEKAASLLTWGNDRELNNLIDLYTMMAYNAHLPATDRLWRYGKYDYFFWAASETETNHFASNELIVPVGEYGPQFAIKLLMAGRTLTKLADRFSVQDSHDILLTYPDLVLKKTTRGKEEEYHKSSNPPLTTLQEGIISIVNAVSLLTAEKLSGHDDPDELIAYLVKGGYINQLARVLYSGFLQPTLFSGRYIKKLWFGLNWKEKPEFTPGFIHKMQNYKKNVRETYKESQYDQFTGYGCPVADREPGENQSGIEALSQALLYIYQTLEWKEKKSE